MHLFDSTVAIESLIPHRTPMRLLDRIVAAGPNRLLATTELSAGAPFCSAAGVPACIGLEYLGQSAAAFFSARTSVAPEEQNLAPRPGMLIASRRYSAQHGYFTAKRHLLIDITPTSAVGAEGLVKFSGTIHVLSFAEARNAQLLSTDPNEGATLSTLCDYLQNTPPFAEGDLSVYLPPADQHSETIQT